MTEQGSRRKLAAILSADAVGYSRLMAADETATLALLKQYRGVIRGAVEDRGGRIVNAPGDALLAEFPSAVEAVHAAVEIQKSLEARNADLAAERTWSQHRCADGGIGRRRRDLHLLYGIRCR